MQSILSIVDKWADSYERSIEIADKRVENWLLMSSFKTNWIIISIYLLTIHYGQSFMRHRKPFSLKIPLFIYDVFLVVLNAFIVKEVVSVAINERFYFLCQPVDYTTKFSAIRLARAVWLFHLSKAIECMDTLFFVLRGRNNLITWLHIYHHSTMLPLTWMLAKWAPGGQAFNMIMINGSVHVLMYSYYAVAALGPAWQRYLWWKKYMTIIQMTQFIYGMIYCACSLYYKCIHPPWVYWLNMVYQLSLFLFFFNHYYQTHLVGSRRRKIGDRHTKHLVDSDVPVRNDDVASVKED